jgi:hypothetical protein
MVDIESATGRDSTVWRSEPYRRIKSESCSRSPTARCFQALLENAVVRNSSSREANAATYGDVGCTNASRLQPPKVAAMVKRPWGSEVVARLAQAGVAKQPSPGS